jgi:hypothetical protein
MMKVQPWLGNILSLPPRGWTGIKSNPSWNLVLMLVSWGKWSQTEWLKTKLYCFLVQEIRCGWAPSFWKPRGRIHSMLFPQLPEGGHGQPLAFLCPVPVAAGLLLLIKAPVTGFRAWPKSLWPDLTWSPLQRPYFQTRSWSVGRSGLQHLFVGRCHSVHN